MFKAKTAFRVTVVILLVVLFNNCGQGLKTSDTLSSSSSLGATPTATPDVSGANTISYDKHITVDQFGYRPNDLKVAVIRNPMTGFDSSDKFAPGTSYQLRKSSDGTVVLTANIVAYNGGATEAASGDQGWWFDFSSITTPGNYFIYDVSKNVRSATFNIDQNVYKNILKAAMRMYYYNRSGIAHDAKYAGSCWTDSATFTAQNQMTQAHDVTDQSNAAKVRDVSGGWSDAGDINKYVTYARMPVHRLLFAYRENPSVFTDDYNIPESGNGVPDIIDEVKWEIDWLKKMQNADGTAALKAGFLGFPVISGGKGESSIADAAFYIPTCTSSTIVVAGMFAHAALSYRDFPSLASESADLQSRAIKAWGKIPMASATAVDKTKLQTNCDDQSIKSGDADMGVDYSGGANDSQAAAVAEASIYLFALTGDANYNNYLIANYKEMRPYFDKSWSIYNSQEGEALLFYTTLPNANASLKATILSDKLSHSSQTDVAGFATMPKSLYRNYFTEYWWGSNEYRSDYGTANLDFVTYGIAGSKASDYQNRAVEILHFIHGVNPFGMVYLSNMYSYGATLSANEIYHTWFWPGTQWSDAKTSTCGPAPGFLPGGPQTSYSGPLSPPGGQPAEKSYKDFNLGSPQNSWEVTEPGIYYQSAYIKLLSAFAQ